MLVGTVLVNVTGGNNRPKVAEVNIAKPYSFVGQSAAVVRCIGLVVDDRNARVRSAARDFISRRQENTAREVRTGIIIVFDVNRHSDIDVNRTEQKLLD